MKLLYYILVLSLSSMIFNCKSDYPSNEEIEGKWFSKNGSILYFQKDNKFVAEKLPSETFYEWDTVFTEKFFNGSGTWKLQEDRMKSTGYNTIVVNFDSVTLDKTDNFQIELMVEGEGFFNDKKPWKKIFFSIGDPDNSNTYDFIKKE